MYFMGKLYISILKHFDHKLLAGNVQLIKILNVDRQESPKYFILWLSPQVCVPKIPMVLSHRKKPSLLDLLHNS